MKVLSIGPDKDLLKTGSVSHERHKRYAEHLEELHAVVFARRTYGTERVQIAPNAWSYPTGSRSTIGLFVDAYRIGRRLLREPGEWVVSAQDPFESGVVAYALSLTTGVPFLLQEHGDFFSTPHWRRESFANSLRYVVGRFLLVRAHHVRAVSARIAHTLLGLGVSPSRITTTPVWVDLASFSEAKQDPAIRSLRPENGLLVLTMARFVPQKNLPLLIEVWGEVTQQVQGLRLLIVGRGEEEQALRRAAQGLPGDAITFLSWTDNPAGALKATDIYVLSSNYEGWGRVCVEALASGIPLIMTDVGCAGEVVRDHENGLVVPVGDSARLAAGLRELVSSVTLRDRLRVEGIATVATIPNFQESVTAYVHALTTCLNNKRPQKVKREG